MTTWFPKPYVLYFDHNNNPVHVYAMHADGSFMCSIMPDHVQPSGHINVARVKALFETATKEVPQQNADIEDKQISAP